VKFWDASAIVPLPVAEESTRPLQARLERDTALSSPAMTLALQRLQQLAAGWHEIDPSDEIRKTASRFSASIRCVTLTIGRGFRGAERRPASLEMVTLDGRLANAARKEGFALLEVMEVE
jgi:predicted nucleic acid-binding protein